jgi:hypothetical protein
MKQAALSFLLALAIEAVSAVFNYLRDKLVSHLNRNQNNYGFDPEYA